MAVAAIGWTGDTHSFAPTPSLSLLFNCYLLTSLSYLLTEESLPLSPSFFTFDASYILTPSVSSIRFSSWRIVSRYLGENLESKSPVRLMVNGLETIYPFSSRCARATSPAGATKRSFLSARASTRYLSCERAVRCDVSGILGRRYRVALKSFHNIIQDIIYPILTLVSILHD